MRRVGSFTCGDPAVKKNSLLIILLFFAFSSFTVAAGISSAFEGFGAKVKGGEGGDTYTAASASEFSSIFSKLKDNGGNTTINLSGNWTYDESDVALYNLSDVTINGLNATVTFNKSIVVKCSNNIVLQGLRVRNPEEDGIQINSSKNVVVDHCSVSGAMDGNIDITGFTCDGSRNVTVSWSILANTWKQSLVKYKNTTNVTFHHNLFYNSGLRLPSLDVPGIFDVRNNIMWQWGSSGTALNRGAKANIVGNYYVVGANGGKPDAAIWYRDDSSAAWIAGNVLPSEEVDRSRLDSALDVPHVKTQSAEQAKLLVLQHAGALPRDAYDEQIIADVKNNRFPALPPINP